MRDDRGAGASAKGVNAGYMSRVLRLTLLAPDIVEAILDGRQPEGLRLEDMLNEFPVAWVEQRVLLSVKVRCRADNSVGGSVGTRMARRQRF